MEVGVRLTEEAGKLWVCAPAGAPTLSRQELGSGRGCWPPEQMQNLPERFFSATGHVWGSRTEEGDTLLRAWQRHDVTIMCHLEGVTYSILMPFRVTLAQVSLCSCPPGPAPRGAARREVTPLHTHVPRVPWGQREPETQGKSASPASPDSANRKPQRLEDSCASSGTSRYTRTYCTLGDPSVTPPMGP